VALNFGHHITFEYSQIVGYYIVLVIYYPVVLQADDPGCHPRLN